MHSLSRHISVLYELARAMQSWEDVDALLGSVMDVVFVLARADQGTLILLDRESGQYVARVRRVAAGRDSGEGVLSGVSQALLSQVVTEQAAVLSHEKVFPRGRSPAREAAHIHSVMAVPLIFRNRVMGVIQLDCLSEDRAFNENDLNLMTVVASLASPVIEGARIQKEQIRGLLNMRSVQRELATSQEEAVRAARMETAACLSRVVAERLRASAARTLLAERLRTKAPADTLLQKYVAVENDAHQTLVAELSEMAAAAGTTETNVALERGSLGTVLDRALDLLRFDREFRKAALNVDKQASPAVLMDAGRMLTVVLAVLRESASRALRGGGSVGISLGSHEGGARLMAADSGPDLLTEELSRAWDVAPQGMRSFGLGPAQRVARLHGGSLTCRTEPGAGSRLILWLPAAP
jgi:signal transduction histidine kinase